MCLCVEREGGYFMLLFFVMLFFEFRAKHQIISCETTNRILKNIFIDNIYNANIFQVAAKDKPVYQ